MSRQFQHPISKRVLKKINQLVQPKEGEQFVINRNPRNLERLRVAYKPSGYHLEKPGRSYWHKLELNVSNRYATASVKHYQNGPVVTASTGEWAIKRLLFRTNDTAAFVNLGRVLAHRCLQSGITEMITNIEAVPNGKVEKFINTIVENGVTLSEPERIRPIRPWDAERPEKPWEIEDEETAQTRH